MDALSLVPQHHQKDFDSRYRIVLIAAQRAKQLVQGAESTTTSNFSKNTSKALEEVLQGRVPYLMGQEAKDAIRDAKLVNQRPIDPALYARPDENAKEIKKELSVYIDDTVQPGVAQTNPQSKA
ncbi:MAG: DNA-directed RNA polymerase subunit omega [Nitrospirota bacterium]|nr:DNA-directed RNA polymerase subunit omega [Nitrospirota bacterium]